MGRPSKNSSAKISKSPLRSETVQLPCPPTSLPPSSDNSTLHVNYVCRSSRPERKDRYKCQKCPEKFGSYQELTGHRESHTKNDANTPWIISDEEESEDDNKKDDADYIGDGRGKKVMKKRGIFKCPSYDRVFQCRRSLGGHRKVHNAYQKLSNSVAKPITIVGDSPTVEEKEKLLTTSLGQLVRDLPDLNVPLDEVYEFCQ